MSALINDPVLAAIWKDIADGLASAKKAHPHYPGMADPVRCVGIIVEEVGEAMQAALDMTRSSSSPLIGDPAIHQLYTETVHTAVTAIQLLVAMRPYER